MGRAQATVVLVHGAFHGAWCWSRVQAGLARRGIEARALDLPGHGASPAPLAGLPEDADALRAALRACDGPLVVCGHSYGGGVVSEAAAAPVRHLVYLAAFVPDAGESLRENMPELACAPVLASLVPRADGSVAVDPKCAGEIFYQDCDPQLAEDAVARLDGQRLESFDAATTRAAWREIDSTYVVCERDGTLPPAAQHRLARRCGRTLRWQTGHSPMLSRPELLVDLLTDLAAAPASG